VADISLVMPVWRPRGDWLHEAVHSALDQHDCDLELIVVDDGNETAVSDMLADVTDPRLHHLRIAHGGVSAARNAGLRVATGNFVRFIDADDVLEPGSTARLRALATPTTIAYEDTVVCNEELVPQHRISSRLSGDVATACLLGEFDTRHVSMLFPRTVVDRAGEWDTRLRVRQDFDFTLRCLEHAAVLPGVGTATFYRRHDASATRSEHAVRDAQQSSRLVLQGFFQRHPDLKDTPLERDAWRRVYGAEARTALYQGHLARALRCGLPLFRLAPREAIGLYLRVARAALRISGAAIARTTAHARRHRRHTARSS
jgi:glycosyltransferase involved in cell wall biosynthesis